jgi:acyl-coenzyme A synthetase/AMP-(fatty) acid ligase
VGRGDRVFTLLGRVPALYLAALGTWKAGAVFCPLCSAFGPDPVAARLRLGAGRVVVTTRAAWQKKIAPQRAGLPELDHVLLVDGGGDGASDAATRALSELLDAASDAPVMAATRPEDPALLHFTSGTTGLPKGALHVHEAVVAHHATGRIAGDLARRDRDGYFWFMGRGDDVIKSSGHLIGPFEVESAMLEHPAVAEAAAIGVPDEIAGQRVKVFVSLKAGLQPSAPLERELPSAPTTRWCRTIASTATPSRAASRWAR